jgi:hypothetical protein
MSSSVEVDTRRMEADIAKLAAGLDRASGDTSRHHANETAAAIRAGVPVRTGALRATVAAVTVIGGHGVTYGGGLRYAWPQEKRTHAVNSVLHDAPSRYRAAAEQAAAAEVSKI